MTTHQHVFSIRLPKMQRWAIYGLFATVAISGVVWCALHDFLQWESGAVEHLLLTLHGVTAALSLVALGSVLPLHIRLAWRVQHRLKSGITALTLMILLGTTGLLLYYGSEEWREYARWTHLAVGVVAIVALPLHVWLGRRRRTRAALAAPRADAVNTRRANALR